MSTKGDILDAVVNYLARSETREPASPFVRVERGWTGRSLKWFADELAKRGDANSAPAALVRYAGGDADRGVAGALAQQAEIQVAVVAVGVSSKAAEDSLLTLLDFVRSELHNDGTITGLTNPLLFLGEADVSALELPPTVSVMVSRFEAPCWYADGK